jgi:hypothetical protein
MMVAKLSAMGAVLLAYLAWAIYAWVRTEATWLEVLATTAVSWLFCLLAFVLGVQSVRNEVTGATADALVMTPVSRFKVVASKLAGSMEFLGIAALLLPLYCFAMISAHEQPTVRAFLHGGMPRCWLAMEWLFQRYWFSWQREQSFAGDTAAGLAAALGDMSWYILLAACGAWAAATPGGALRIWARGLGLGAGVLIALTLVELIGIDPESMAELAGISRPSYSYSSRGTWLVDLLSYNPFSSHSWHGLEGFSVLWTAVWFTTCVALRLGAAWIFLRRAARNFDRVALD